MIRFRLAMTMLLLLATMGVATYAFADPPPPPNGVGLGAPPSATPPTSGTPTPPSAPTGPAPPVAPKLIGGNSFSVAAGQVVCRRSHFTGLCNVAVTVCDYWANKYNHDTAKHRNRIALRNHDIGIYNTVCPAIIEVKSNGGLVKLHPLPFLQQGAL